MNPEPGNQPRRSQLLTDASGSLSPDLRLGEDGLARPVWAYSSELMQNYYDTEWGNEVRTEIGLYERISLEGMQAGLSWATVLNKREAFREVFHDFDPDIVAGFSESKIEALLQDARIIRSRPKISAVISNAEATIRLRDSEGLVEFLWSRKPQIEYRPATLRDIPTQSAESIQLAKDLKAVGYKFIGPTSAFALMEAVGMVNTHLIGSWRRN